MSLLRAGIAGFDTAAKVPIQDFKQAIHTAGISQGAIIGTPNFHQGEVDFGMQKLVVMCNRNFPVVAFTHQIGGMQIARFVDGPADFAAVLSTLGFEIADAAELMRAVGSDDLKLLSPADLEQANYWQPKRIGDIIFHWWD